MCLSLEPQPSANEHRVSVSVHDGYTACVSWKDRVCTVMGVQGTTAVLWARAVHQQEGKDVPSSLTPAYQKTRCCVIWGLHSSLEQGLRAKALFRQHYGITVRKSVWWLCRDRTAGRLPATQSRHPRSVCEDGGWASCQSTGTSVCSCTASSRYGGLLPRPFCRSRKTGSIHTAYLNQASFI